MGVTRDKPDGCSGWQSRLWRLLTGHGPPWENCCIGHDWAYIHKRMTRLEADRRLRRCMEQMGYPRQARIYYWACRLLGWWAWIT